MLSVASVCCLQEDPYMMLAEDPGPDGLPRQGNDRFEGYCVDLLHEIAKIRKVRCPVLTSFQKENNGWHQSP